MADLVKVNYLRKDIPAVVSYAGKDWVWNPNPNGYAPEGWKADSETGPGVYKLVETMRPNPKTGGSDPVRVPVKQPGPAVGKCYNFVPVDMLKILDDNTQKKALGFPGPNGQQMHPFAADVDGVDMVATSDAAAQAREAKLNAAIADQAAMIEKLKADVQAAQASKDEALAAMQKDILELRKQLPKK